MHRESKLNREGEVGDTNCGQILEGGHWRRDCDPMLA